MFKHWKILTAVFLTLLIIIAGFFTYKKISQSHTSISHFTDDSNGSLQDFYQTAQNLVAQTTSSSTVSFLAVGDIMLSRGVASNIIKSGSVDYPFLKIADILKSDDFNFANLEGPAAPSVNDEVIGGNSLVFGDPAKNLSALKDYNFQIINLANNHAFDQGLAGVDATKSILDNLGIAHEGTGDNLDQAWTPAVVTANGIKICFVGAAYGTNGNDVTAQKYVAEIAETALLKTAIITARQECDFVVATMHAGIEYTRTPNQQQVNFAHTAINDGADMVIGAHPHWVQPIEKYNGKYIFYSLGNFIFDQDFSTDTMEGLTIKITISQQGSCHPDRPNASEGEEGSLNTGGSSNLSDSSSSDALGLGMTSTGACADELQGDRQPATLDNIELLPVIIQNSQPRPATSDEAKKILQDIGETEDILK